MLCSECDVRIVVVMATGDMMTSNYNYIALDDLQSFWGQEVRLP